MIVLFQDGRQTSMAAEFSIPFLNSHLTFSFFFSAPLGLKPHPSAATLHLQVISVLTLPTASQRSESLFSMKSQHDFQEHKHN